MFDFYRKATGPKSQGNRLFQDIMVHQQELAPSDCLKLATDFGLCPRLLNRPQVLSLHMAATKAAGAAAARTGAAPDSLQVFKDFLGRCAVEAFADIPSQENQVNALVDMLELDDPDQGWRNRMR